MTYEMRPETIEFTNRMPVRAFVRGVEQHPYHWHDALEIMQVLKGTVHIGMGSEDHLLHEGDIAVINVDEIHRLKGSQQDNQVLFIQIDGHFYRNILFDNRELFIYCCSAYHEAVVPEKYYELKGYIARLVWALNDQSHKDNKKNIEDILTTMLAYLTDSFDYLRLGPGTVAFEEKQAERLKQISKYMDGGLCENPGLKTLAEKVNISKHHLSHDIKNKFGYTFQELFYYSKVEHAAKLLLSTDERIVDIAQECGFSDVKYLIKYFKQNFQCTPSQFQKMYRADVKTLATQLQCRDYPLSDAIKYLQRYLSL
ncbi:MAG: AraC family transcriptional regulator [Dehalobacterium sp.]